LYNSEEAIFARDNYTSSSHDDLIAANVLKTLLKAGVVVIDKDSKLSVNDTITEIKEFTDKEFIVNPFTVS
jgi:hypothetical protein